MTPRRGNLMMAQGAGLGYREIATVERRLLDQGSRYTPQTPANASNLIPPLQQLHQAPPPLLEERFRGQIETNFTRATVA